MLSVAAFLKEKLQMVPEALIPKLRGYYVAKIQLAVPEAHNTGMRLAPA